MKYNFCGKPVATERKGWYDVPTITVEAESPEQAVEILKQKTPNPEFWCIWTEGTNEQSGNPGSS